MNETLRNIIMGIIVLLLLLITVAIVMSFYNQDKNLSQEQQSQIIIHAANSHPQNQTQPTPIQIFKQEISGPNLPDLPQIPPHIPASVAHDIMTEFDLRSAYDPLVEATRRPPKYITLPMINNPHFNYPTRGFTDSFSLMGYLLLKEKKNHKIIGQETTHQEMNEKHSKHEKEENKIVKLFGRQKYPNSSEYEYYVIINTGFNDNIKYSLDDQRKELFDGDSVFIDILQSTYRVKLLKNRTFEYNPYVV